MVELVDTQDLKSCSRWGSAGSIPAPSTFMVYSVTVSTIAFDAVSLGSNPDRPTKFFDIMGLFKHIRSSAG